MSHPASASLALELTQVSKRFGAAAALDGASLAVRQGTVHALLGENGAGKTTLMRIAFGLLTPDSGRIAVFGTEHSFRSPAQAIAAGVGMVHQHFTNVPAMSVAENVALGGHGALRARDIRQRVRDVANGAGLALDPDAITGDLPVGAQQRLEIVKALARDARILLLDEPTAVLAPAETEALLTWLRRFAAGGGSAVLITHKLREALAAADDVTVLRRGATVWQDRAASTNATELAAAMLGESRSVRSPAPVSAPAGRRSAGVVRATRTRLTDDRGVTVVREATFELFAGEIVGLAAVEGSGQRELLLALAGRRRPAGGSLSLPARIGFIPEDRHRNGMILGFTLAENIALLGAGARRGRVHWRDVAERTRDMIETFDVRGCLPGRPQDTVAGQLSGGNQQKLVLARELSAKPDLVVAENPTRGLDIRSTAAVHDRLRAARDAGAAVVIYSSDLDEVLGLAERVLVLHAGELREVAADPELVGRAMLGLIAEPSR